MSKGFNQSGVLGVLKGKMVGMKDDLDKVKEELETKTASLEEERASREKVYTYFPWLRFTFPLSYCFALLLF